MADNRPTSTDEMLKPPVHCGSLMKLRSIKGKAVDDESTEITAGFVCKKCMMEAAITSVQSHERMPSVDILRKFVGIIKRNGESADKKEAGSGEQKP